MGTLEDTGGLHQARMETRKKSLTGVYDLRVCQVARAVHEALHPVHVIVFGLRARGDYHQDSDVDLMVITADEPDRDTLYPGGSGRFSGGT